MPKQFKTYTRFEGGLNTKTNARSIKDNELAQANNVIVDEFGLVKSCGKVTDNTSDYDAPNVTAQCQGATGLFQATVDENASGTDGSYVKTFVGDAGDGSTNVTVDVIYDNGSWSTPIDLGANTGGYRGRLIFHTANGAIRVCDQTEENVSTKIKWYGYVNRTSGVRHLESAQHWESTDAYLAPPTYGAVAKNLGAYNENDATGSSSATTLYSQLTDSFEHLGADDLDNHLVADLTDEGYGTISAVNGHEQITFSTLTNSANFDNGNHYCIAPPRGTGFNISVDTSTDSDSVLAEGSYQFATTFIYDGNQESMPFKCKGHVEIPSNGYPNSVSVHFSNKAGNTGDTYNPRITGGRVYWRMTGDTTSTADESNEPWTLFLDIDFKDGVRPTLTTSYAAWKTDGTPSQRWQGFVNAEDMQEWGPGRVNGKLTDTFESLNGYPETVAFNCIGQAGEKYQTSVVSNGRTFIGNVKRYLQDGLLTKQADSIYYSEVGRHDVIPLTNFLKLGANDGESIVKLEAYADRLLVFKEKTLYIINISGGSESQWFLEDEHKNKGVLFHSAVAKTEDGIVWANKNGLYFYNGNKVINLQTKILDKDWSDFVTTGSLVGYEPTHKHICVIRAYSAGHGTTGGTEGDAYIYSFITNSFTFIEDMVDNLQMSNVIVDAHNNMTMMVGTDELESYDGEPDSISTFDVKLKDDDFGLPNIVKKIYGVTVEYASGASNSNGLKYFYTNSSGTKQGTANAGDLASTSNDLDVNRITFGTPLSASSFQVQLDLDGTSVNKINSVGVEYRATKKRIT